MKRQEEVKQRWEDIVIKIAQDQISSCAALCYIIVFYLWHKKIWGCEVQFCCLHVLFVDSVYFYLFIFLPGAPQKPRFAAAWFYFIFYMQYNRWPAGRDVWLVGGCVVWGVKRTNLKIIYSHIWWFWLTIINDKPNSLITSLIMRHMTRCKSTRTCTHNFIFYPLSNHALWISCNLPY